MLEQDLLFRISSNGDSLVEMGNHFCRRAAGAWSWQFFKPFQPITATIRAFDFFARNGRFFRGVLQRIRVQLIGYISDGHLSGQFADMVMTGGVPDRD